MKNGKSPEREFSGYIGVMTSQPIVKWWSDGSAVHEV